MLRESHRPGIEPATCKSQVQRPTAEPPRNILTIIERSRDLCSNLTFIGWSEQSNGDVQRWITVVVCAVCTWASASTTMITARFDASVEDSSTERTARMVRCCMRFTGCHKNHRSRIRYLSKKNREFVLTNFLILKKFVIKIRTKIRQMPEWA